MWTDALPSLGLRQLSHVMELLLHALMVVGLAMVSIALASTHDLLMAVTVLLFSHLQLDLDLVS